MRCAPNSTCNQLASAAVWLGPLCAILLVCGSASALNPQRGISQYAHTSWRIQQGIFRGYPTSVTQTSDGYVWVGTMSGLLRFDGVRFVPWNPTDGSQLPSGEIRALLGARDGGLWIGTRRGLVEWKNNHLIRFPAVPGLVVDLLEDREGTVWATRVGLTDRIGPLCRIAAGRAQCFYVAQGIPLDACCAESLAIDAQDTVWFGTPRLLIRWQSGSPTTYSPAALRSNNAEGVSALAGAADGSLWVGMSVPGRGLGLQHLVGGVLQPAIAPGLDSSKLEVTDLLTDREGALWVGTSDQGILRIDHGSVKRYRSADGLTSDFVDRLYQDREGDLWVVTPRGIDIFRDLRVATWSAREGLTTDNAVSVAAARDGTVWVGNAGGLDAIRDGNVSSIRTGKGLPGNQVTSLFEDHASRLWVGIDNGLFVEQDGRFQPIRRKNGSSTGFIVGITEDRDHDIWAETSNPGKLLHIRDLRVLQEFPAPETPSARPLAADAAGDVWLGLRSGDLARFHDGQMQVIPFPHEADSMVRQVVVSPDGTVMAATTRAGMIAWRRGRTQTLTKRNGLPCNEINGFLWDTRQDLWLHTACGLIDIDHAEIERWWESSNTIVSFRSFDAIDGLQPGNAFFDPAARSPDGRLWFATGSVIQMVDPAHFASNSLLPPVHVEDIVADHKQYLPEATINLPKLSRDIEIDYTALSFAAPEKVLFRYRLDGHDKDWQSAGTRRQAFYTDLRPGPYRFRVIACNNDGLWNQEGAAISFVIEPAFYQTAWFEIVCIAAAGSVLWLLYLAHLKRLTAQLQERLTTRLEERERIARELHDTLLQGFQGLMLRFQSVLKNIPKSESAHAMLESALDRADEVLVEGRQRVRDLREGAAVGDLSQALAAWGNELAVDSGTRFSAVVAGTPFALDPAVADDIRRIGLEALTNAFRHARAETIEVEITYEKTKLRLTVRDDGSGMDEDTLQRGRSGHWGLICMRERAEQLGATLTIWSHPGAGTEISLTIPTRVACPRPRPGAGWTRLGRIAGRDSEARK